jgi:hypothetical protein
MYFDADTPRTLTQARPAPFDHRKWTATAIEKPAIVLIDAQSYIGLLLARDATNVDEHELPVILEGVHWIRIPVGLRLAWLKWRSRVRKCRLPDEWLFNEVHLYDHNGAFVADIAPKTKDGLFLPYPSRTPYPLRELTHGQYDQLARSGGRQLHQHVTTIFPCLADKKLAGAKPLPKYPYPFFTG